MDVQPIQELPESIGDLSCELFAELVVHVLRAGVWEAKTLAEEDRRG